MASVYKRVRPRPGKPDLVTWETRWRDLTGAQRKKSFGKKVDADRYATSIEHSMLTGAYVDPKAGKVTLEQYAEEWRAAQVHRPTTEAHHETMLRRHVYPHLGHRLLADIRPSEVQAWIKRLSGSLAPSTVGVVHRIVAGIFKAAVRDRRVATSPCEGTKLPKRQPKWVEPLSTEAVAALLAAVPDRYRTLFVLAAGTGMRQGEVFGLTVDRINFLRRQVTVDRQLILVPGKEPFLAPPKTAASNRTIPLPQVVVDALAAHLAAFPAGAEGFLFTTDSGKPIRRTAFSAQVWQPAARAAGLPPAETFHGLRHHYASLLIRHGESVKTVQARLGHASASETLDTYSHLWPDSEERTREAVDEAWRGAVVPPVCPQEEAAQ
ncbi:tyrosine-type recombinase/integrase [Geodermatophilus sp. CPCC 206100]|uniref:tyrosine-type recombinase/integrase n=1 Tax=Geodermatophilus sp. CPCC 206100 TaxID=3020054 RepID=UPI003B00D890